MSKFLKRTPFNTRAFLDAIQRADHLEDIDEQFSRLKRMGDATYAAALDAIEAELVSRIEHLGLEQFGSAEGFEIDVVRAADGEQAAFLGLRNTSQALVNVFTVKRDEADPLIKLYVYELRTLTDDELSRLNDPTIAHKAMLALLAKQREASGRDTASVPSQGEPASRPQPRAPRPKAPKM